MSLTSKNTLQRPCCCLWKKPDFLNGTSSIAYSRCMVEFQLSIQLDVCSLAYDDQYNDSWMNQPIFINPVPNTALLVPPKNIIPWTKIPIARVSLWNYVVFTTVLNTQGPSLTWEMKSHTTLPHNLCVHQIYLSGQIKKLIYLNFPTHTGTVWP